MQTWVAICTVSDQSQVVWNRLGLHSELGHHAGFIAQHVTPAVELNDPCAYNALTEIFVRRTDEHLPHAVIPRCLSRGRSERVIRLVVDHGPHHYSHCLQRFLENGKL